MCAGRKDARASPYTSITAVYIESSSFYVPWSLVFIIAYTVNSPGQFILLIMLCNVQVRSLPHARRRLECAILDGLSQPPPSISTQHSLSVPQQQLLSPPFPQLANLSALTTFLTRVLCYLVRLGASIINQTWQPSILFYIQHYELKCQVELSRVHITQLVMCRARPKSTTLIILPACPLYTWSVDTGTTS